jgi:NAD(P)-dependent dehydrogenase (short-subunit alcohol dehydrogenase family)
MPGGYGASKATLNAMTRLFAEELPTGGVFRDGAPISE